MIVELIGLVFLVILICYVFFEYRTSNLPPGPRPWPLIGNPSIMNCSKLYLYLTDLAKTYGEVFTVYVGRQPMVVLSGSAIKEALVHQSLVFAGRPPRAETFRFNEARSPTLFLMAHGPAWRLFRKLGHQTIKVYGQERLQSVMDLEVDYLCKRLESLDGKPNDISKEFGMSVTNVICHQLFGSRYEIDDPEFLQVYKVHDILIHTPIRRSFLDSIPFIWRFLPESEDVKKVEVAGVWRDNLMKRNYQKHLETFDVHNIRDYTDALIMAKLEAEQEDSSCKEYLTEEAIIRAGLATVFLAGSETTSTTLAWGVRYLLHNPDIQTRLHQEIDQVIGRDETPKLTSKNLLPLLEAFMAETLRMSSILPLDILHRTTADTTLKGYAIPKETTVVPNLWSLHHDSKLWPDPFKFSIDRFLDEEGKFVNPPSGTFFPFSAGRRVCMGEVLARSQLFLFLARLLQKFRFENPPNTDLPCLEGGEGVVMCVKPFNVCVISRE